MHSVPRGCSPAPAGANRPPRRGATATRSAPGKPSTSPILAKPTYRKTSQFGMPWPKGDSQLVEENLGAGREDQLAQGSHAVLQISACSF